MTSWTQTRYHDQFAAPLIHIAIRALRDSRCESEHVVSC